MVLDSSSLHVGAVSIWFLFGCVTDLSLDLFFDGYDVLIYETTGNATHTAGDARLCDKVDPWPLHSQPALSSTHLTSQAPLAWTPRGLSTVLLSVLPIVSTEQTCPGTSRRLSLSSVSGRPFKHLEHTASPNHSRRDLCLFEKRSDCASGRHSLQVQGTILV